MRYITLITLLLALGCASSRKLNSTIICKGADPVHPIDYILQIYEDRRDVVICFVDGVGSTSYYRYEGDATLYKDQCSANGLTIKYETNQATVNTGETLTCNH